MLYVHNIIGGVWAISEATALNNLPLVTNFLKGGSVVGSESKPVVGVSLLSLQQEVYPISEYGEVVSPENAPAGSVAVIEIEGVITKHDQTCGNAGMRTKADLLKRCYANDNIEAVVLKIDSGGGEGMAMRLMVDAIAQRNKAVIAFVDGMACSAAYGIAAACDKVLAGDELMVVGSIGTYCSILDFREQLKMNGINLIEVYASASSDKNKAFRDALNGDTSGIRAVVDAFNEEFLRHIELGRGAALKSTRQEWGTGKEYFARDAVLMGLVDEVDSFANILNQFRK